MDKATISETLQLDKWHSMYHYYDCSNLALNFRMEILAGEEVLVPELLDALQKEINSHIESLSRKRVS